MNKIWNALDHKGRIATVIGFLFALPVNIRFVWHFYQGVEYTKGQLEMIVMVNVLAMIWFILPSSIKLSGPKFTLEVKD